MFRNALDELTASTSTTGDVAMEPYVHPALAGEMPAETTQRVVQQQLRRGRDIAARGTPVWQDKFNDPHPVVDESGAELTGFKKSTGTAFDSMQAPRKLAYTNPGKPPELRDPYADAETQTNAAGQQFKVVPGLPRQRVGTPEQIAAQDSRIREDKQLATAATVLGRKLTLDEYDYRQDEKQYRAKIKALETETGIKSDNADEHFASLYESSGANNTKWFSSDFTPDAIAKRRALDARKADMDGHAARLAARAEAIAPTREMRQAIQRQRADAAIAELEVSGFDTSSLRAQAAAVAPQQPVAAAAPAPEVEKPFFGFGDAFSGIWDAISGLGTTAPAAFYQLVEGMERPDKYSPEAKAAFDKASKRAEEMQQKTLSRQLAGESTSVGESFREAGDSLGFSIGTMGAAIPASMAGAKVGAGIGAAVGAPAAGAGAAPGAVIGGTIGALAAGMAASFGTAYRMAGANFLNESFKALEEQSQKENGRPMSEAEKELAMNELLPVAKNTALWEAGPEAVGNAATLGFGKILFGFGKAATKSTAAELAAMALASPGKALAKKIAVKAGALTGATGTELATETITQVEQDADARKAQAYAEGRSMEGERADWSAEGIGKAFRDVAPQTLALLGLMGGAGGAVKLAARLRGKSDDGTAPPADDSGAPPAPELSDEAIDMLRARWLTDEQIAAMTEDEMLAAISQDEAAPEAESGAEPTPEEGAEQIRRLKEARAKQEAHDAVAFSQWVQDNAQVAWDNADKIEAVQPQLAREIRARLRRDYEASLSRQNKGASDESDIVPDPIVETVPEAEAGVEEGWEDVSGQTIQRGDEFQDTAGAWHPAEASVGSVAAGRFRRKVAPTAPLDLSGLQADMQARQGEALVEQPLSAENQAGGAEPAITAETQRTPASAPASPSQAAVERPPSGQEPVPSAAQERTPATDAPAPANVISGESDWRPEIPGWTARVGAHLSGSKSLADVLELAKKSPPDAVWHLRNEARVAEIKEGAKYNPERAARLRKLADTVESKLMNVAEPSPSAPPSPDTLGGLPVAAGAGNQPETKQPDAPAPTETAAETSGKSATPAQANEDISARLSHDQSSKKKESPHPSKSEHPTSSDSAPESSSQQSDGAFVPLRPDDTKPSPPTQSSVSEKKQHSSSQKSDTTPEYGAQAKPPDAPAPTETAAETKSETNEPTTNEKSNQQSADAPQKDTAGNERPAGELPKDEVHGERTGDVPKPEREEAGALIRRLHGERADPLAQQIVETPMPSDSSGFATDKDGQILIDPAAIKASAAIIDGRGGDSVAWVAAAYAEEAFHQRQRIFERKGFVAVYARIWKALVGKHGPEFEEAFTAAYGSVGNAQNSPDEIAAARAAEFERMVAQRRSEGRISEKYSAGKARIPAVARFMAFIDAAQPAALEEHLAIIESFYPVETAAAPAVEKADDVAAKPTPAEGGRAPPGEKVETAAPAQKPPKPPPLAPALSGKSAIIATGKPNGTTARVHYEAREASDLAPFVSLSFGGAQNRQRTGNRASDEQIAAIASNPSKQHIGVSPVSTSGTPVIDEAAALSGNGRLEGVVRGYNSEGDAPARHRAVQLEIAADAGIEGADALKHPVVVAVVDGFDNGAREDFIEESNPRQDKLPETVADGAARDAAVIGDMSAIQFTEGGVLTAESLRYIGALFQAAQRGLAADTNGKLNLAEATRRVQLAALSQLAKAAGVDVAGLTALLETDAGKRTLAVVTKFAPQLAALDADLSIGGELLSALSVLKQGIAEVEAARARGQQYTLAEWELDRKNELIQTPLSQEAGALVTWMVQAQQKPTALKELLSRYLESASHEQRQRNEENGTANLFGDTRKSVSGAAILERAQRQDAEAEDVSDGGGALDEKLVVSAPAQYDAPAKSAESAPVALPQEKPAERVVSDERAEQLRARIKKRAAGNDASALRASSPEKMAAEEYSDAVQLGVFYIEGGHHRFEDWSAKMREDFGESINDQLKSIYETARITIESPGSQSSVGQLAGIQAGLKPPGERIVVAREKYTKRADESVIPAELAEHLDAHQRQGAAAAIGSMGRIGGFLLADGTGAGKTRQALTVAHHYAKQGAKVVIVTKAETIKPNWKANTFGGSYKYDSGQMGVNLALAKDGRVDAGQIGITTYENLAQLRKNTDANTVLIFDESHAMKNDSARAKFGMEAVEKAKAAMFMSATPADKPEHIYYLARIGVMEGKTIERALSDLGMQLVTVQKRDKYGVKRQVQYWAEDQRVTDAERNRLFSALFNRMTVNGAMIKREIEMSGVHVQVLRLALPPQAHAVQDDILRFFEAAHIDDLQGLMKARVLMHQRRQQEPFKIASTVILAKRELAAGRQVVIFVSRVNASEVGKNVKDENGEAWREILMRSEGTAKSLREALEDAGIHDIAEIHGNADQESLAAMDDFQKGRKRIVIATIESGGTGINLDDTAGNRPRSMIVVTAPFDAVGNVQAAGRIWRLKTLSGANLFYLFGDTEVDEWNASIIGSKMATLGAVVEGQVRRLDIADPDQVNAEDFSGRSGTTAAPVEESVPTELPMLTWKPFKTKAGQTKFNAPATKEFWAWWNTNGKKENTEGLRVQKWQDEWQVWSDRDRSPGITLNASSPNSAPLNKRLRALNLIASKRALTLDEQAEKDALEREEGQDFMDFAAPVTAEETEAEKRAQQAAADKAEIARRKDARLIGGGVETQTDLLGPQTDKSGNFSLFAAKPTGEQNENTNIRGNAGNPADANSGKDERTERGRGGVHGREAEVLQQQPAVSLGAGGKKDGGLRGRVLSDNEVGRAVVEGRNALRAEVNALGGMRIVSVPSSHVLGGMAMNIAGDLVINFKEMARLAASLSSNPETIIRTAIVEEVVHLADIRAAGGMDAVIPNVRRLWKETSANAKSATAKGYPWTKSADHLAAEYIRALAQLRAGRPLSEDFHDDKSRAKAFRDGLAERQPEAVEAHVAAVMDKLGWKATGDIVLRASSPTTDPADLSSPKNAVVDAKRVMYGLDPARKRYGIKDREALDRAMAAMEADPDLQERTIARLSESPEGVTAIEQLIVLHASLAAQAQVNRAADGINEGRDLDANRKLMSDATERLALLYGILDSTGTEASDVLRVRKLMAAEDFSLAQMLRTENAKVNGGKGTSQARILELVAQAKAIKEALEALEKLNAEREANEGQQQQGATYGRVLAEVLAEIEAFKNSGKDEDSSWDADELDADNALAADGWDMKGEAMGAENLRASGPNDVISEASMKALVKKGGAKIHKGHDTLEKFTDAMVKDLGERFRPHAEKVFKLSKAFHALKRFQRVKTGKSVRKPKPLTPEDAVAAAKKNIAESGKLSQQSMYILIRAHIAAGAGGGVKGEGRKVLDEAVKRTAADLQAVKPGVTEDEVMLAFTQYGQARWPNKEALATKLREVNRIGKLVLAFKDAQQGVADAKAGLAKLTQPKHSGAQRDVATQAVRDAEKAKAGAMKELVAAAKAAGIALDGGERNLKSALDAAKTRMRNAIADVEREIATKERQPKQQRGINYDAEATALKAKLAALRKQRDADLLADTAGLESDKEKALLASIAELEKKLAAGDIEPAAGTPTVDTATVAALKTQRDALRKRMDDARKAAKPVVPEEVRQLAALEKRITEAEARLASGNLDPRTGKPTADTAEVAAARAKLAAVNERIAAARKAAKPVPDAELREVKRLESVLADAIRTMTGEQSPRGQTMRVDTAEQAALREQIAAARAAIAEQRKASRPVADAEQKELLRLENELAKLMAGESKPGTRMRVDTEQQAFVREQIAAKRAELAEMRAADPEIRIEAALKSIERRGAELKRKIAAGDFAPKPKPDPILDARVADAQFAYDKLREQYNRGVFEKMLANRNFFGRMWGRTQEAVNTARALVTSFDISAVFRQGGFIALAHPIRAAKIFIPMLRAFASEKYAHRVDGEIQSRANSRYYKTGKLFLADQEGHKLSKLEEAYMSRFVSKLRGIVGGVAGAIAGGAAAGPVGAAIGAVAGYKGAIPGSARAYSTFLNLLRADSFDVMLNGLAQDPRNPTTEELRAIGNFINVATGRGTLPGMEGAGTTLATVFFSPRLAMSRFQLLAGQPFYGGTAKTRALIAKEYVRFMAGAAMVYALAIAAQDDDDKPVETDPRSSDFGKVRFGNTRLDPMTGLLQPTVLASRLATGETKKMSGKVVPIVGDVPYGQKNAFGVAADFLRTKLSPATGAIIDLRLGENVVGEKVTPATAAKQMVAAMSFRDIKEAMDDQGMPDGAALGMFSLSGMGVNTFDASKPKPKALPATSVPVPTMPQTKRPVFQGF